MAEFKDSGLQFSSRPNYFLHQLDLQLVVIPECVNEFTPTKISF